MKTTRILLICIVLMGLQSLSANIADGWRILKVNGSWGGRYYHGYSTWTNYFNQDNPLVVDSCYFYRYANIDGDEEEYSERVIAPDSYVQDNGDTYSIYAPVWDVHHHPVNRRYHLTTKSSNGDILSMLTYDMTTGNLVGRIIYEYDTQAKITAVYGHDLSDSSYSKVIFSYDESGRLITKTAYTSPDSLDWLPQQKEEFQYSGLTIPNQYCINEFKRYLYDDIPVFSHYQISNYSKFDWLHDQWHLYYGSIAVFYDIYESGLMVTFSVSYLDKGYFFNNLGQLTRHTETEYPGSIGSQSTSEAYTWGTWGLPNEDPAATPETPFQIEAYPNPFAKNISISSSRSKDVLQDIRVYNLKGQLIKQLPTSKDNNATWDGTDSSGHSVANGVYFVRVKAGEKSLSKKIVLTK